MAIDFSKRPNRFPWPPVLYGAAIVAAYLIQRAAPCGVGLATNGRALGLALLAIGLGLDFWAMATMFRARTNILPNRAADRLVDYGPFAFSRNPIYLGNTVAIVGVGVGLDSLWFVIAALLAAAATQALAIRREEAHLALKFGADWARYSARTHRWIGAGSFRRAA